MTSLHLVDIENLCCGDLTNVHGVFNEYRTLANFIDGDRLVIGVSHFSFRTLAGDRRWTCYRIKVRSGPNGADSVLAEVLEELSIEGRYERVVLGSGDGGFTNAMAAAGRAAHTVAIAREGSLSRSLAFAVHESRLLPRRVAAVA